MSERRNDIGNKVLIAVVAILITLIMGFSITAAQKADGKANINGLDIRELKTNFVNFDKTLGRIELDIKEIKNKL